MPQQFKKINAQGQFCEFPGVTIVSAIQAQDSNFWQGLYQALTEDELISHYFAPLPYESYHMTVIDLYTQAQYGAHNWAGFISEKKTSLQALHAAFAEQPFSPKITIKQIHVAGVIQLYVSIPPGQSNLIHRIADLHGVSKHVPSIFHITLAYQYQPMPEAVSALIHERLIAKLNHLLFVQDTNVFHLAQPELCYFHDMTRFTPWDAQANPFRKPAWYEQRLFQQRASDPTTNGSFNCTIS